MAENIEKIEEKAVLPTAPELPQVTAKMTAAEVLKQVQTYKANAEASLAKLQQNTDRLTDQLNSLQKMRLMIMGQRELVLDLYNKITGESEENQSQKSE